MFRLKTTLTLCAAAFVACAHGAWADGPDAAWKMAAGPLATRWSKQVDPNHVHPEYPRPQLVRTGDWTNLNGLWDFAIRPRGADVPRDFDGRILVPFPVESALSGVMKRVSPEQGLWYRRSVVAPDAWRGQRVHLHFEAVDWEATVYLDGRQVGAHRGGYAPFTFDVTEQLTPGVAHELIVAVHDPSDAGTQPCGKQHNKPEGIWYTPSTGIWQTVWLEPVPVTHVRELRVSTDVVRGQVTLAAALAGPFEGHTLTARLFLGSGFPSAAHRELASGSAEAGRELTLTIPRDQLTLWSPELPALYEVELVLDDAQKRTVDRVGSQFAMRSISVIPGRDGRPARIALNGKPIFLFGPLDQGFWPDGLYTAPTDEALRSDLQVTKRLGFNLVRKHVKVEPARWYDWCDRLGLLVWQDMPSGDRPAKWPANGVEIQRSADSARQYRDELKAVIDSRRAFSCIVAWVPFNEGWGQFDTVGVTRWVKDYDPGRLVIPASGGNEFHVGDVYDIHKYPGPAAPPMEAKRAAVLGEFGGLGLPLSGHLWIEQKTWGYRTFKTRDDLTRGYLDLTRRLAPLIDAGLSAAVYTQTTDVETEVNGLVTYDRELIKMDADKVREANTQLIERLK